MSKADLLKMIEDTKRELVEAKSHSAETVRQIKELNERSDALYVSIETRLALVSTILKDRCNVKIG